MCKALHSVPIMAAILLANAQPARLHAQTKTLSFLRSLSGKATVSGIHNDQKTGGVSHYTERVKTATGIHPGLWGGDFSYDGGRVANRWNMIYEAERQWNQGALVNLMWHACPPTVPEPCSWEGDIHSKLSNAQWNDLITDGGTLNKVWKARMDAIAVYLEYLEGKGVEALFRPHHEMNQGNFWWGGRPGPKGTAALYRVTRDYLTRVKGLKNLVWTWDVQDLDWEWALYDPGAENWDVFALDVYSHGFTDSLYRSMLRIAGDKPIALGEVANLPTPAELVRQPRWAFVMGWAYMTFEDNTPAELRAHFTAPNLLSRDEMPGWDKVTVALGPDGKRRAGGAVATGWMAADPAGSRLRFAGNAMTAIGAWRGFPRPSTVDGRESAWSVPAR